MQKPGARLPGLEGGVGKGHRSGVRRAPLAALLWACFCTPGLAAEIEVTVSVQTHTAADTPSELALVAEPAAGDTPAGTSAAEEYSIVPGRWVIDLPEGRWRLRVERSGYWSEEAEVDAAVPDQAVELRLWRAGILRGGLGTTAGEALPGEVELYFEGDAYSWPDDEPPAATVRCPVVGGIWRCEVPAGRLNLVLTAGSFVPHALWEVEVAPDEVRGLATLELELGGVVRGRVELADGGVPAPECEVRLAPSPAGEQRTSAPPAVPVAEDGSFELRGVPAGEYVPGASQPDYLTAAGPPLTVVAGESVELPEPLVLQRPASLELVFSPPAAPGGRGWRFLLLRLDAPESEAVPVARGKSDPSGVWVLEDLPAGTYEVKLTEGALSGLPPRRVELTRGRTTVPIELPVLLIEGQVLVGGEPMAAKLTFSRPEEQLRATFVADPTGSFGGLLAREGSWRVQVDAAAEGIRFVIDPLEVRAQGSSGVAYVEILLPDTVVEGEVSDLRGDPQAGATVRIQRRGAVTGSHSVRTDSEGRFQFRALEPGPMSVMAQAGSLRSQWFEFVLYEGRPVPPLQLVVK